jgi:hypothetical protein
MKIEIDIPERKFNKGDLVWRSDAQYYGIVVGFDDDNDIYIKDFSGMYDYDRPYLLDWANKYSLLTKKEIDNGTFFRSR